MSLASSEHQTSCCDVLWGAWHSGEKNRYFSLRDAFQLVTLNLQSLVLISETSVQDDGGVAATFHGCLVPRSWKKQCCSALLHHSHSCGLGLFLTLGASCTSRRPVKVWLPGSAHSDPGSVHLTRAEKIHFQQVLK